MLCSKYRFGIHFTLLITCLAEMRKHIILKPQFIISIMQQQQIQFATKESQSQFLDVFRYHGAQTIFDRMEFK